MPDENLPPIREPDGENEPGEAPDEEEAAPAVASADRKAAVEAAILASSHAATAQRIAEAVGGIEPKDVRAMVADLNRDYESAGRAFEIREVAAGFRAFTRPKLHGVLKTLRRAEREERLTAAALETLAVIAYRQPILRADIDAIRGVQSDAILRGLLDKGLVRIVGRADVLGRPLLYGTTQRFLEFFGLGAISDLPKPEEIPAAPIAPGAKPLPVGGVRIPEAGASPVAPPEGEGLKSIVEGHEADSSTPDIRPSALDLRPATPDTDSPPEPKRKRGRPRKKPEVAPPPRAESGEDAPEEESGIKEDELDEDEESPGDEDEDLDEDEGDEESDETEDDDSENEDDEDDKNDGR